MSARLMARALILLSVLLLFIQTISAPVSALPLAQSAVEPQISARAAILVEYPSGRIIYQKGAHQQLAPASTTKILTAILAMERGNLNEAVSVASEDMIRGSKMGLKSGEKQTMHNLLYGLMLPSGNDAAMTIARHIGSQKAGSGAASKESVTAFAGLMNARLAQLGLKESHFVNPHGLDKTGHYSSAYDLASLTWHAMHFPVFNEIVKQPSYNVPGHSLRNINKMIVEYPGADGAKTGYTRRAGLCLVTTATRNGRRLISVVLNAPKWYDDSKALLDYGFAQAAGGSKGSDVERLAIARRAAGEASVASAGLFTKMLPCLRLYCSVRWCS
ncbi:MAG: D-alanyl-D-alanine carboxypeptidase family protein [Chloroflexia bacterium]